MEVYWEMDISSRTQWSHDGHPQYISLMTWKNYEMDHLYHPDFLLALSCLVAKIQKGDNDACHQQKDIKLHKVHLQYAKTPPF